jgi:NADPH:quinone reductase-like Zn-dependent oxidoreductase
LTIALPAASEPAAQPLRPPGTQEAVFFAAAFKGPDVDALRELLESGDVKPVVEKRYERGEVADALRCLGEGHAPGKIVINV